MVCVDLLERMAKAAHAAARERYPLLETWDCLTLERQDYQCRLMAHALSAFTARDVLDLLDAVPEIVALPCEPSPFALAELQEAAIADSGTTIDARRRYQAVLAVASHPLTRNRQHAQAF